MNPLDGAPARRLLFAAAVSVAILVLVVRALVTVRDADISDFRCFYAAAQIAAVGHDPYDQQTWSAAVYTDPSRIPHCARSFIYPFWTALALVPLTALPEDVALAVWEGILFASSFGGVMFVSRTRALAGTERVLLGGLLWSQPMFSAVANAQFGPVIFAALAMLAFGLERARGRLAAAAWLLLLLKPHLSALVAAVALIKARRDWRITMIVVVTAAVVATNVVLFLWPLRWARAALDQRLDVDPGLSSLWTLASDAGLPAGLGAVVALAAAALYVGAVRRSVHSTFAVVCVAIVVTLIVTPYARPHDFVVLAIPASLALAAAKLSLGVERRLLLGGFVVAVVVLPWAVTVGSLFGLPAAAHVAVPIVAAALSALALRTARTRGVSL